MLMILLNLAKVETTPISDECNTLGWKHLPLDEQRISWCMIPFIRSVRCRSYRRERKACKAILFVTPQIQWRSNHGSEV